jgi:hypothetical protein
MSMQFKFYRALRAIGVKPARAYRVAYIGGVN